MDILSQVKTVLRSLIGIGGRKRGEEGKVNPVAVIAIAFIFVALFLATLAFVARSVVAAG